MTQLPPVLTRFAAATRCLIDALHGRTFDSRLDEEIAFHVEMETARHVAAGLAPAEARRRVLATFGGRQRTRDDARDERRTHLLDDLARDVRFALRSMRRQPGFAFAVVLTLALGIGVNAAMFGVIDRLLLRAPPHIADPDRVLILHGVQLGHPGVQTTQPYAMLTAMRGHVHAFADVAVTTSHSPIAVGHGVGATSVTGALVSVSYFATLGVRPALGRFFLPDEEVVGRAKKVAVLGYGFWKARFAGRRAAVGQTLDVGTSKYTIVGVAPRGFSGTELSDVDLWLPVEAADGLRFGTDATWATDPRSTWLTVVARLEPGASPERAAAQATAAYRTWKRAVAPDQSPLTLARIDSMAILLGSVVPGKSLTAFGLSASAPEVKVSRLLAGVSVIVLLIACANVANLLLLQSLRRRREIAVRLALGVSRRRLVSQLLVEGLVLTSFGAVAALVVAHYGSRITRAWLLGNQAWSGGGVDGRVLAFTIVTATVAGLLTSLLPALQASRPELTNALKSGARDGARRSRTRTGLVVVQAALAILLVAGAGLFVDSVRNVNAIDLGIDVDHALVAQIKPSSMGLNNADTRLLFDEFARRAAALPGVRAAAISLGLPFGLSIGPRVVLPGRPAPNAVRSLFQYIVSPSYFDALGMHLLAGREFTAADRLGTAPVVIVNETMARLYWPGQPAIGQCVQIGSEKAPCTTVIGIVNNTHRQDLLEGLIAQIYQPIDQVPSRLTDWTVTVFGYNLIVRARNDPASLVEPLRRSMQAASSAVAYPDIRLTRDVIEQKARAWYLGARVFVAFGALALLLAGIGLFSTVAFTVRQRQQELGIRTALGAHPSDLLRLTMSRGLLPPAAGIVIGIVLTLAAGRFVEALLFGVSAHDPVVLGVASAVLLIAGILATLAPALRAARADPMVALRTD